MHLFATTMLEEPKQVLPTRQKTVDLDVFCLDKLEHALSYDRRRHVHMAECATKEREHGKKSNHKSRQQSNKKIQVTG